MNVCRTPPPRWGQSAGNKREWSVLSEEGVCREIEGSLCVLYTLNHLPDIHTGLIKMWVWNGYIIIISQISALWGLVTQPLPY